MRFFISTAAVAAVLAGLAGPALSQDPDTVLARVNGEDITFADVEAAQRRLPPNLRQAPLQMILGPLVDQIVSGKLLAAAGRAQNLQDSQQVRERLAEIEDGLIQQVYLEEYLAERLTEDVIHQRYDETVAAQEPETEIQASHILVEQEEEAIAIIAELDGGADFATLARERSTGPSASRGGDLGYFTRGQMVAPFAEAAFAMEPGERSSVPVKTDFGWHVILVVDRRETAPPPFEQLRPQIEQEMQREIVGAHLDELRAGAEIERFNLDGTPLDAE